jgi:hypothetical protein
MKYGKLHHFDLSVRNTVGKRCPTRTACTLAGRRLRALFHKLGKMDDDSAARVMHALHWNPDAKRLVLKGEKHATNFRRT